MTTLIATIGVLAVCMAGMAIGVIVKGKLLCKDCGLDPITGERIGDCSCAGSHKHADGCPNSEDPSPGQDRHPDPADSNVVSLSRRN